jgi:hypothetical protein
MATPDQLSLDPYLVLTDAAGTKLDQDDDGGGDLNARIVFRAEKSGTYRIVATSYNLGNGGFTLTVRDSAKAAAAEAKFDQARVHATRGEWKEAAAEYARVFAAQPLDGGFISFEYAAVLLLSGDQAGYRKVCAELVEKSGQGEFRAYHAARACTLAPDAVTDAALAGKKAAFELKQNATEHWSLTEQAALACRASHYHEAATLLEKSLAANAKVGAQVVNWAWLALVEQRRGNAVAAHAWLEKATQGLAEFPQGVPVLVVHAKDLHLHNWLEAQVLRREVEVLLAPKP